jgi:uncharacterized phiE125 gp8 family phage protein
MPTVLITPSVEAPISLDDARLQCQIDADITDEDDLIEGYINAATDYCERYLGCPLMTQEWMYKGDFSKITALKPNLLSIESVEYIDNDGAIRRLSPGDYYVDIASPVGEIHLLRQAPSVKAYHPQPVSISFTCGFGNAAAIPESIKQCIRLLVSHWFRNRELSGAISSDIAETATSLLNQYRLVTI